MQQRKNRVPVASSSDRGDKATKTTARASAPRLPAELHSARVFGRQEMLICLALLALVAAVYWPVYGFDFINYDDPEYVSENVRVQAGLSFENVKWAFQTFFFENWHPLTWLSYMVDYQLFGLNAGAFHLVNVVFHALNTLLLFVVFHRMTGARWPSALLASVFAVHPLHVESVAWVSERKDVLSTFFLLLALGAYMLYATRPGVWRYLCALLFFALGLMAKPMLVTLPFVLLLLDYWPLRRISLGTAERQSGRAADQTNTIPHSKVSTLAPWRLVVEKVPFFVFSVLSSIVTYHAQHGARVETASLPVLKRVANAIVAYMRYIGKTLWPENLAVYYPHPGWWPAWQIAGAVAFVAAVTFFVWRLRIKRPYLLVGWFWFLGTLVPVIGLVQVGGQSMADRYMYIPLIGLLVMIGWGARDAAQRFAMRATGGFCLSAAALLGCITASSLQVRFWRDSEPLFEHALRVTDGSTVAHNNLGDALLSRGLTNDAMAHFSAAMKMDPEDFLAYGNMGNVLVGAGNLEEAIAHYQKGLTLNPRNPELNHNLGHCLAQQKKFSEAIGYYARAMEFRAEFADAQLDMGSALLGLGRFEEAISNYNAVLRMRPDSAAAHLNIANALTRQGRQSEAVPHFAEALRLDPANAEAHLAFALCLTAQGRNAEAETQLAEALRLKPNGAQFHFHLALLLETEKRIPEAIARYREVLKLNPDFVLALNNLAWIFASHEDPAIRNGLEAVKLAERSCELSGRRDAFLLGTLAAAYAEATRFPDAVRTAQEAIGLATKAGQKELVQTNQKLLACYQAGKTYRESQQKQ